MYIWRPIYLLIFLITLTGCFTSVDKPLFKASDYVSVEKLSGSIVSENRGIIGDLRMEGDNLYRIRFYDHDTREDIVNCIDNGGPWEQGCLAEKNAQPGSKEYSDSGRRKRLEECVEASKYFGLYRAFCRKRLEFYDNEGISIKKDVLFNLIDLKNGWYAFQVVDNLLPISEFDGLFDYNARRFDVGIVNFSADFRKMRIYDTFGCQTPTLAPKYLDVKPRMTEKGEPSDLRVDVVGSKSNSSLNARNWLVECINTKQFSTLMSGEENSSFIIVR